MSFQRFFAKTAAAPFAGARVTFASRAGVGALMDTEYRFLPLILPYGVDSLPPEGAQVALAAVDGTKGCVGVVVSAARAAPGELLLYSAGGAAVHLRENGDVTLNGVRITKEGALEVGRVRITGEGEILADGVSLLPPSLSQRDGAAAHESPSSQETDTR